MSIRVTDTYSFLSDGIDIKPIRAILVNLEMIGIRKILQESYGEHAAGVSFRLWNPFSYYGRKAKKKCNWVRKMSLT